MDTDSNSNKPNIASTFDDPEFSDLEVHCGDTVIHVNKYFLQLHSDVFRACFRNDTTESKTGVIKIDDFDVKLIEKMLKFMYGIKIMRVDEIAHELYVVAEKYNVGGLMELCLKTIKENIDQSNLQKCIDLSSQFNLLDLEEKTIEFIVEEMEEEKDDENLKAILFQNPEISWKALKKATTEKKRERTKRRRSSFMDYLSPTYSPTSPGYSFGTSPYNAMTPVYDPHSPFTDYEAASPQYNFSDSDEDAVLEGAEDDL